MSNASTSALVVVVSCTAACSHAPTREATVPVGDVSLHVDCRGQGEPVVVLDSGLGADGSVWSEVQDEVAKTTTVCAYDRAGLGASGAAPTPHTNRMMANELSALLSAARVPDSWVLVGHSMGGVNVRLLAESQPDSVAGMVLVDSMSESQPKRYWSFLSAADMTGFRAGIASLPEGIDLDTLLHGLSELEHAGTLGDKPLVVLSRTVEDGVPGATPEVIADMLAAWQSMQLDLSKLSTNSAYVLVDGARHGLPRERPRVVAGAILEVVDAARGHRPVDASAIPSR